MPPYNGLLVIYPLITYPKCKPLKEFKFVILKRNQTAPFLENEGSKIQITNHSDFSL